MDITLGDVLVWLIIAALVGVVGELVARRRTLFGIVGGDYCRVYRHLSGRRCLALAHAWRDLPQWRASHHFHSGCGGLGASLERFRVSSRVRVVCSLLSTWRLRRSASPPLPLVLGATDRRMGALPKGLAVPSTWSVIDGTTPPCSVWDEHLQRC